jgi:2-polyprenyl-3-methyl-5-hydroxy-6-metoxy-1,4-benzoquinol methylase
MKIITDDKGWNQIFSNSLAAEIRQKRRCDYMISLMSEKKGGRILEIGSGTGEASLYIAQKTNMSILGIDICEPFVNSSNENNTLPNLQYRNADFTKFEEIDNLKGIKYDYIIGNGILHHLYYTLDQSLAVIKSLLAPEGKIIFLEPNLINPYCAVIFSIPFFREKAKLEPTEMAFTKTFILKKLQRLGYLNIKIEYRDFLLPNTHRLLIKPLILAGGVAEKIPLVKCISQSLFISAEI